MTVRRRVLLCCEQYPPSVGGVQEVMRQIAERLAIRGIEVVVATSAHPARKLRETINGVTVVSFGIAGNRIKGITGPVNDYQSFLRSESFDAILIKAAQQWTFDAAVDVLPEVNARKVFIPCGFSGLGDPRCGSYFEEMPAWLRLFDSLVFYAGSYQDIAFAQRHGLTQLRLIPNGVDEREFADLEAFDIRAQLGVPADEDLLLSVGTKIAAKGHWEVLAAFKAARLPRPATLVLNAGAPSASAWHALKRSAKHLFSGRRPLEWLASRVSRSEGKRVIVTDLPRESLLHLYKAADLFVFASHIEYSPLVLFESVASATPFIASAAGNSREIAAWTGAGTIVEEADGRTPSTTAFARAIEAKLEDLPALRAVGMAGRQVILSEGFTWGRIIDQYIDVLELQ